MRFLGISLCQKVTFSLPRKELRITPNKAVKVVDFKPPPVPEGDAPITINMIIMNREACDREPIGMVLKPTVVIDVIT